MMSTVTNRPSDAPVAGDEAIPYQDKPEGPIAAAILAGGVGALAMGVITTLSESVASFSKALNLYNPVGPLSGKTILTVAVWLASWVVLHLVYRRKQYESRRALTIALILVGLGVVGTFPTFFELFAAD
jgi:lysylphosphatidylglycerol synthetase-like protein (DUF2156 family)